MKYVKEAETVKVKMSRTETKNRKPSPKATVCKTVVDVSFLSTAPFFRDHYKEQTYTKDLTIF